MAIVSNTDYGLLRTTIASVMNVYLGAGIDGTKVVFLPSNFDRPVRPYATVAIRNRGKDNGIDQNIYEYDEGPPEKQAHVTNGPRTMSVQVSVYDNIPTTDVAGVVSEDITLLTPADRLDNLKAVMTRPEIIELLDVGNMSYLSAGNVFDLSEVVGSKFEMSATLEMDFVYLAEMVEEDANFVETVIPPTIENGNLIINS